MHWLLLAALLSLSSLASVIGQHLIELKTDIVDSIIVNLDESGHYNVTRIYADGFTKSTEAGSYRIEGESISFKPYTVQQCEFAEQQIGLASGLKIENNKLFYEIKRKENIEFSSSMKVNDKVLKQYKSLKPCV